MCVYVCIISLVTRPYSSILMFMQVCVYPSMCMHVSVHGITVVCEYHCGLCYYSVCVCEFTAIIVILLCALFEFL